MTPKGEWVVDFGQNLTGCIRFRVKGHQGMKVRLRCFEVLDADGNAYFDNLREAKAQVSYICRDDAKAIYREQFSFQGFRYAMLEGWESRRQRKTLLHALCIPIWKKLVIFPAPICC